MLIALLATVAVAIGLGAYLGRLADGYEKKPQYEISGNTSPASQAPAVTAPYFAYGDYLYGYINQGYTELSMSLGDDDAPTFNSAAAAMVSGVECGQTDITEYARLMHKYEGLACGYFNSGAFEYSDAGERRIRAAYEVSLLGEAAASGIDDILILGIDVTEENVREVSEYLCDVKAALGDCSVGIAISVGTLLMTEDEVYIAARLKSACDFVALDLRYLDLSALESETGETGDALAEYLSELDYYLSAYYLRLVFSPENKSLFDRSQSLGLENLQVAERFDKATTGKE